MFTSNIPVEIPQRAHEAMCKFVCAVLQWFVAIPCLKFLRFL